ncbi:hypothetical protein AOA80_08070 [Methanomassiliicoccales archaeon RumEn M1]|jgi:hypothetical protein|nr:hypothetical protein AOA80_08070 [Methanomassiliicoccales archaeon RumEn M1]
MGEGKQLLTTVAAAAIVAIPSLLINGAILAILLASLLLLKEWTVVRKKGSDTGRALLNGALLAFGAVFLFNVGTMLLS